MEDSKKIYCSKTQKEMLIQLLTKDPQLISGKFTSTFTFKDARNRWIEIADTLNAIPGCVKDWSQWKRVRNNLNYFYINLTIGNNLYPLFLLLFYLKTWQDSRTKVRSKKAMVNRHVSSTGGGPQISQTLTPIENQILDLVNPITIDGDETISMPVTNFEFGDISKLPIQIECVSPDEGISMYTLPTMQPVEENNCAITPITIDRVEKKCMY
ncbi:uncharacterized protein LOC107884895 [Acyrthosiphon pisum]|uniref:Regulatory protein zeste n=1 Tax=Acyrthosiphon pisum TaxID=7029 RepID=A0A8R2JKW0_ACYPI|nr:uncharacterized protein LOC107884895 [Acyrthosiphon pisum]